MADNSSTIFTSCLASLSLTGLAKSGLASGKTFLSPTTTSVLLMLVASIIFIFLVHFVSNTHKKLSSAAANKSSTAANNPLPPGPVPWPIIGNLPELLLQRKPAFRWIHGIMKEMNVEIACIRLGNVHVIPVTSPEIAREFLKNQDAIFASRPLTMASKYSSRGFLTTVVSPWGDQWTKMRRILSSELFSHAKLNWLLQKRIEEADNLIFYIHNQCKKCSFNINSTIPGSSSSSSASAASGAVIDLRLATRQYSGNVIRKMMFNKRYFGEGRKDGGPGLEEVEHIDAVYTTLSLIYAFAVSDYLPCLRWLDLNGHEKLIKESLRVIDKYHDPIIDERILRWRSPHDDIDLDHEPEDLLDVLISLKDNNGKPLLSLDEIKAQTTEIIFGSIDNPSNAVEWAIAEMITEPDMLRKAVDEIDMVVGKDRLVQESDLSQLNYVKACAREALRLHPFASFNPPHLSITETIVGGYTIPKGSHVLLSKDGLGRNPKVWDEPLKFNPERHLKDDNSAGVELAEPDLRFISFSTGRRGCMAVPLGSAITTMLLARLLQGFSWSVPPGESKIDLSEAIDDLALAKPLRAHAKPRLPWHVYPTC